jgi:ferric-dicitrate binding protein FerR (iron transport regulator)
MDTKANTKTKIISFLNGEMTFKERRELELWIDLTDENTQYFHELKSLYNATHNELNNLAQTDKEWKRFKERITKERKMKSLGFIRIFQKAAAVLILPVMVAGFLYSSRTHVTSDTYKNNKLVIVSPLGEKSQVILPDSTKVWLNSASKLTYSNFGADGTRTVHLEGEGFFSVTKDSKHPFIVVTKDYSVKVLGTRFNVRSYPDEVASETILEEGKVTIDFSDGRSYKLNPGQMAVTSDDNHFSIENVNVKTLVCWKENVLKINNTSVKDLVPMLERWYGVHVEIPQMSRVADKRFTMTIKTESLQEVLQLMKYVTPLKYSIKGENVKIEFLDI